MAAAATSLLESLSAATHRQLQVAEQTCSTLRQFAAFALRAEDPDVKAGVTLLAQRLWKDGKVTEIGEREQIDQPGRPPNVQVLPPGQMPRRGFGSERNRAAMVHALVHVENVAIDLSWDILLRFPRTDTLPRAFFSDWAQIAQDEARHYLMLRNRLRDGYQMEYGDFPAHGGLWSDALSTKDDLFGRLALEHCVHEARGLDVTRLQTIPKFADNGDVESSKLLENIIADEVTHTGAGCRWFRHLCREDLNLSEEEEFAQHFHSVVRTFFRGKLRGPFSTADRDAAGIPETWYLPLSE